MKPHKISTHSPYSDNFMVVRLSWNFVSFHEILSQTDAENFSFLSWSLQIGQDSSLAIQQRSNIRGRFWFSRENFLFQFLFLSFQKLKGMDANGLCDSYCRVSLVSSAYNVNVIFFTILHWGQNVFEVAPIYELFSEICLKV